ncbi:PEP-CTERM sorting domain-containing protein [Dechloromonas denitrificans]|uniref:PEP-CTERM sorting domain-containing protein n=1 Tax=Dechloromonas denitrificans TaxID=281362 RepID=UPI001CFA2F3A|nr:PEP-CTERM sorting domain-containing protein [Dechloromonas denitrificans]UCV09048.1 PEP-CTERM sorting domain-containing protein [Dechloromonas denitrificans]
MRIGFSTHGVLLSIMALLAADVMAAPQYSIRDLGVPYDDGRGRSYGTAIADTGYITGNWSSGTALDEKGLIWNPAGAMSGLILSAGRTIPRDINDFGQVAGSYTGSSLYDNRAFVYTGSTVVDLGHLGGGSASANGINNAMTVVGSSSAADGSDRAFVWQNGSMSALASLGGQWSGANDINNGVDIAGYSSTANGTSRAVLWRAAGAPIDLGDLGGGSANAQAINSSGQITGYSANDDGWQHAFLWSSGTLVDLMPGFSGYSYGFDVNRFGSVVGMMSSGAFLWQAGDLVNLSAAMVGSGWRIYDARGINDSGQIVGSGWNPDGQFRAYVLTPVPEPETYAVMLAGLGLMGFVARRRKQQKAAA